jgi:hypothetical protein
MAFHIDASVLPRILSYNHARELFHDITPIRGGDQSVKRLGNRNDATKWLRHEIRDGVDVFVAGFHNSNIVEYHPTHYNISMCGWNTLSTQLFITAITGSGCYGVRSSELVPRGFDAHVNADATYNGYGIYASERYAFDYVDTPMQEMPRIKKYKVNRKRMNEVRKIAKPFYEYIDAMGNLMGEEIDGDVTYYQSDYRNPSRVVEDLPNEYVWWDMFNAVAWMKQGRHYDYKTGKQHYYRSVKAMKDWIDDALKANNPQVLDEV